MHSARLLWFLVPALLAPACGSSEGPVFDGDGGSDAGREPDGGPGVDAGDTEAPRVIETVPAHGEIDVSPDAPIRVRFSEAMAEERGTVVLEIDGSAAATPALEWSEDGTELSFAAELPSEARVRVTVEADFEDLAGHRLRGPVAFAFDLADVVPPRVLHTTPAEGETGVAGRLPAIEIAFSEPMGAEGTLTIEGGPGTVGSPIWSTAAVRFPVSGLAYGTGYRVVLSGFTDLAGNPLDGTAVLGDGAIDFATGADLDPPRVVDSNPDEGQVNVSLRFLDAIVVVLDEPMDTSVTTADLTAPGAVRTLTGTWSADGRTLTFPLSGELAPDGDHALSLSHLRDLAGNLLDPAAHLYDGNLDFSTGADDVVPAVVFATPGEGSTDASFRQSFLRLVFNQAMDTSLSALPFDEGGAVSALEGSWNLAGTRLTFDVTERIRSATTYALDARAMRDATGRPLDLSHPYLGDGVLDFSTGTPGGENCRDALTVAEATGTTGTGGVVWDLPELLVIDDDGGLTCDTAIPADAVIRYTKTSPAGGTAGGRYLHVRAADLVGGIGTTVRVNLEIFAGACEPEGAGADAARQACLFDAPAWDRYLAGEPGDYYLWVSHSQGSTFRPITVVVEEIDGPPIGESCAGPLGTASGGGVVYTPPASGSAPHVWDFAEGAFTSFDMGTVNTSGGGISCDSDSVGFDAVVRFDKATADSVIDVSFENDDTFYSLSLEVLDRCRADDPGAQSLACVAEVRRTSSTGPPASRRYSLRSGAGPLYFWLATGMPYYTFPQSRLMIREVPASPGIDCANAVRITAGETVAVSPVSERLFPPSCAPAGADLTWYRVTATGQALLVTGTTAGTTGALALVDPATGAEISCAANIAGRQANAFVEVGREVCIAVESGQVTSLSVDALPYSGVLPPPTDAGIERPLDASGAERPIGSANWMRITPTTLYAGVGLGSSTSFVLYSPRTGGARAEAYDDYPSGVGGYEAIDVGEAVFGVSGSTTAGTAARLHRLVDGAGTYGHVPWDTGTSYPAYSIRAMTYDGTRIWLVSHATTTSHQTRVWTASPTTPGPLALVGDIPGIDRVVAVDNDGTYLYIAAGSTTTGAVYRMRLADVGVPGATPERLGDLRLPVHTSMVLDDPASPGYLYVRGTDGLFVVSDPAGASPRLLGLLYPQTGGGRPMARDPISGAILFVEHSTPNRIVRFE